MAYPVSALVRKNSNVLGILHRKRIKGTKRAFERELKREWSSFSFGYIEEDEVAVWW